MITHSFYGSGVREWMHLGYWLGVCHEAAAMVLARVVVIEGRARAGGSASEMVPSDGAGWWLEASVPYHVDSPQAVGVASGHGCGFSPGNVFRERRRQN